jgi:predicted small lipoprotein YifL
VPKIFYTRLIIAASLALSLSACGRKGALEAPSGDMTPRVEAKRNTFFNNNAKIEKQKSDVDPSATVLNPQLTAAGQVVPAVAKTNTVSDKGVGVAPVGGGRKAKRILPPKDSFILDPLL